MQAAARQTGGGGNRRAVRQEGAASNGSRGMMIEDLNGPNPNECRMHQPAWGATRVPCSWRETPPKVTTLDC